MHFSGQYQHAMLPERAHDEGAMEEFVFSLKTHIQTTIGPGNKKVYDHHAKHEFKKRHSRAPASRHEVGQVMTTEPYWQLFSSLSRSAQEVMWDIFGARSERQSETLVDLAKMYRRSNRRIGSLRLDPSLKVPGYNARVDIHIQPGGYHTDLAEEDVFAGALYDTAVYVYTLRNIGTQNEDLGLTVINYLEDKHSDFSPQKILDMGCGVGHSTVPYRDAFPKAEVFGIDVGAPMLRYAHARAESMEKAIHFEQRDAENTGFPDASFDLIVSHILFHETSAKAVPSLMRESYRLLKPGGIMVHVEVPAFEKFFKEPYGQFARDWSTHYNAEPFWGKLHEMDLTREAACAGFAPGRVHEEEAPSALGGSLYRASWHMIRAQK